MSILNQQENQYLSSILFFPIWIGIHTNRFSLDVNNYQGYRWFPDQSDNVNYTNWAATNVSQIDGPVAIENSRWKVYNLTSRLGYICKKGKSSN